MTWILNIESPAAACKVPGEPLENRVFPGLLKGVYRAACR
jgi:hypothetical protein